MANTGISNLSLAQILTNDLQEYLAAQSVIFPTIWDLSDRVAPGAVSVGVPRVTGGSAGNWVSDGSDVADAGMAVAVDTLLLNQFKQYSNYIYDSERQITAADLNDYFYTIAPTKIGDLIEQAIYAQLKLASSTTPDNIRQLTGASNLVPTVADVFTGALVLDELNVPKADRFAVMPPAGYHALIKDDAVINGSKSLSNEALVNGAFSKVAGIELRYTTNATAAEMIVYHKEAVAFAFANGGELMAPPVERQESKMRDFLTVKAVYGSKVLDAGKRTVLFNATGAAA